MAAQPPAIPTGLGVRILYGAAAAAVLAGLALYAARVLPAAVTIGGMVVPGLLTVAVLLYIRRAGRREPEPADAAASPELSQLPRTSAAEFRAAAWPLWHIRVGMTVGSVSYIPAIGIRGVAAAVTGLLTLVILGEMFDHTKWPESIVWGIVGTLVLGALTVLLIVSKARSNAKVRARLRRNRVLAAMSTEIDRMVDAGEIPLAPEGWSGPVASPLKLDTSATR